ncbi:hypothetical protein BSKO_01241 [Bryopsis sp. KO-2023]|nr:hypothetical protein BSKO_01241 [Bryopsis sp. KO-2023]
MDTVQSAYENLLAVVCEGLRAKLENESMSTRRHLADVESANLQLQRACDTLLQELTQGCDSLTLQQSVGGPQSQKILEGGLAGVSEVAMTEIEDMSRQLQILKEEVENRHRS